MVIIRLVDCFPTDLRSWRESFLRLAATLRRVNNAALSSVRVK